MGKPVTSNVARAKTASFNTKINREVYESFKDCCSELGYPMNVMLETFMRQYVNGKFKLYDENIIKFKEDNKETSAVSTTVNHRIYHQFKSTCKSNGYYVAHVVAAFMEKFANGNFILEYVSIEEK